MGYDPSTQLPLLYWALEPAPKEPGRGSGIIAQPLNSPGAPHTFYPHRPGLGQGNRSRSGRAPQGSKKHPPFVWQQVAKCVCGRKVCGRSHPHPRRGTFQIRSLPSLGTLLPAFLLPVRTPLATGSSCPEPSWTEGRVSRHPECWQEALGPLPRAAPGWGPTPFLGPLPPAPGNCLCPAACPQCCPCPCPSLRCSSNAPNQACSLPPAHRDLIPQKPRGARSCSERVAPGPAGPTGPRPRAGPPLAGLAHKPPTETSCFEQVPAQWWGQG